MKKRFTVLSAALVAFLMTSSTYAASYSFNYEASDSSHFQGVSGDFGSNINIGDTVTFTLTASSGNAFSASIGDNIWAILGLLDSPISGGTRYSDYSWSFYNQGALVGSGSSVNESTQSVHMGPYVLINFNGLFDTYKWTATLNSSTTGNDNNAFDISLGYTSAQFVATTVPEPETYALFLAGLTCFGLFARRKKSLLS
ncbi:PEP-CTERM sorting domain-containing protein [Methylophilus flavus]|jgi:hypothetical protein|uniref:PEP-CTERM sorting domain-containing protein n=1 Tax=Methylophilus flavus TaxID=640084 RepID=A0ABW3PAX0_9PROT